MVHPEKSWYDTVVSHSHNSRDGTMIDLLGLPVCALSAAVGYTWLTKLVQRLGSELLPVFLDACDITQNHFLFVYPRLLIPIPQPMASGFTIGWLLPTSIY